MLQHNDEVERLLVVIGVRAHLVELLVLGGQGGVGKRAHPQLEPTPVRGGHVDLNGDLLPLHNNAQPSCLTPPSHQRLLKALQQRCCGQHAAWQRQPSYGAADFAMWCS